VSFGDSSFTTTELTPEMEPRPVDLENSDLVLSPEETRENATTVNYPSPGSDALSDINKTPHAQIEISSQVDETVEGSSQSTVTISSPSLRSTILSADLPSEDTTEYHQNDVDEETSTENMAKVKDDVSSTSELQAGDNPQHEEDIYPDSDNEPNSSDDQQDEAKKQSSYLRQLASSMSRFILG
jgi:TATA-binding protein-associated factor Taf7